MLGWAFAFLLTAIAVAILGFAVIAGTAAMLFKVAVFVLLALAVISFVVGRRRA